MKNDKPAAKGPIKHYLNKYQNQALRNLARQKNKSILELVRRGIDLLLGKNAVGKDPAYQLIGLGASGATNIGEKHDDYLIQETEQEGK